MEHSNQPPTLHEANQWTRQFVRLLAKLVARKLKDGHPEKSTPTSPQVKDNVRSPPISKKNKEKGV